MQLQIETTKLKEMLAKAVKGAGNNKLIPLTSLVALEVKDGKFTIVTTDAENYLYVSSPMESEDFYVAVNIDTLAKLISKITSETTTLEVTESSLVVNGNGTYKIGIPNDSDGGFVVFPNPIGDIGEYTEIGSTSPSVVSSIISSIKPALRTTMEYPQYTRYYMGDSVVGTDTFKISSYAHNMFEEPKLIEPSTFDLVGLITDEDIHIYSNNNKLLFKSENYTVFGIEPMGIESFSIGAIKGLVNQPFESNCTLNRNAMLSALDRVGLMVDAYADGAVTLDFTDTELTISSKFATESVDYIELGDGAKPFTCMMELNELVVQLKSQFSENVVLHYGAENTIKLTTDNITNVVALSQ